MSKSADIVANATTGVLSLILDAMTNPVDGRWEMPWHRGNFMPINATTNRAYTGVMNPLLLGIKALEFGGDNRWAGFGQWRDSKNPVRKGQTGTPILFAKQACAECGAYVFYNQKKCKRGHALDKREAVRFVGWGSSKVFNNQQTVTPLATIEIPDVDASVGFEKAASLITNLDADLRHGGGRAYYSPREDYIGMPEAGSFHTVADYWATNLHEHAHWTGHASRVGRKGITRPSGYSNADYAFEELVAELTSAFMCHHLGIRREGLIDNHAKYLASWKQRLTEEPEALQRAASQAGTAMRFLLEHGEGKGSK